MSFAPGPGVNETFVQRYAERLADTPAARKALEIIAVAATTNPAPPELPEPVRSAYDRLNLEAGLQDKGPGAPPGHDRESFSAQQVYEESQELAFSFGIFGMADLLSPLRQLSFWKMKDRARRIGESGAHQLLGKLRRSAGPEVRFHLMGHSFGCIVVSAMLAGPPGAGGNDTVASLVLVQGALSMWSYCTSIPSKPGTPGYFHRIIDERRVTGPIVTTQSEHDNAVGRWYPLSTCNIDPCTRTKV